MTIELWPLKCIILFSHPFRRNAIKWHRITQEEKFRNYTRAVMTKKLQFTTRFKTKNHLLKCHVINYSAKWHWLAGKLSSLLQSSSQQQNTTETPKLYCAQARRLLLCLAFSFSPVPSIFMCFVNKQPALCKTHAFHSLSLSALEGGNQWKNTSSHRSQQSSCLKVTKQQLLVCLKCQYHIHTNWSNYDLTWLLLVEIGKL